MSISSMSEAKLVRERPAKRDANRLEKSLGMTKLVERDKPRPEKTPKPSGVSDNVISQLVRWIPTETIALYVAFLALFDPLQFGKGAESCAAAGGFEGRWAGLIAFTLVTPVIVFLIHMARVRKTAEPFRWPKFEMVVASIAFAAWALALPDTPLHSICGYEEAIGAFIVLVTTGLVSLVADATGHQPSGGDDGDVEEDEDPVGGGGRGDRDGEDDPGGRGRPEPRDPDNDTGWIDDPPRRDDDPGHRRGGA